MLDQRSLHLDLAALGLCVLVIFLGLALASYDPQDPIPELVRPLDSLYRPDQLVYPASPTASNLCGRWGALAADLLLTSLGVGAYYLLLTLAIVDYRMLRRRWVDRPLVRAGGWLVSLGGLTTLSATWVPYVSAGPVIGSGGYLGALGAGVLHQHFALAGSSILAMSVLLAGLLLATDYVLVTIAQRSLLLAIAVVAVALRVRLPGRLRLPARRRLATDLEEGVRLGDEAETEPAAARADEPLAIRIRGKRLEDTTVDEHEDEQDLVTSADSPEPELAAPEDAVEAPAEVLADDEPEAATAGSSVPGPHFRVRRKERKVAERSEREQVIDHLNAAASQAEEPVDYQLPDLDLLIEGDDVCFDAQEKEVRRKAQILEKTFADFGFRVKVVEIETGPVIAQYEVELEAGLRLARITGLADDLAIALRVPSVRIVAPIPGKNTVGIEVPNEVRQVVRLREVIEEATAKTKKMKIPLFLGKDVSGNPLVADLSTLPHLLIAGRTGTGKSVCLNAIISSILMTRRPDEVRMLMIDPKMVELSGYGSLPHLMHPVVTDMKKAEAILAWAVDKMEERYALLARAGVRHITSYNQLGEEELYERLQPEDEDQKAAIPQHLPFIVIVADEMADLMMTAGKEVEQHIIRLAQKSRAVGIHLILATQKPTVDVITGLIKSNLPARIAFQVASRTDSRVVLDEMGADKLLGNGDMLFLWPGTSMLLRGQGTYLSDDEIDSIVEFCSTGEQDFVHELVHMKVEEDEDDGGPGPLKKRDELYESAVDVVVREGRGSVSLLQRTLGVGYGRAARLIDFMAEDHIVGEYNGSQAREVLISIADWERMQGMEAEEPEPPRRNVVRPEPATPRGNGVPGAVRGDRHAALDDPQTGDDPDGDPDADGAGYDPEGYDDDYDEQAYEDEEAGEEAGTYELGDASRRATLRER